MMENRARFLDDFKQEAAGHLQQLQRSLLALQQQPADHATLQDAAHDADTLSGAAVTLGLGEIADQARRLRDRLAAARDGQTPVDVSALQNLVRQLEVLAISIDEAAPNGLGLLRIVTLMALLDDVQRELLRRAGDADDEPFAAGKIRALASELRQQAEADGLQAITEITRRTERALQLTEDGVLRIDEEISGLLLQGLGFVELLLESAAVGQAELPESVAVCALLDELLETAPKGENDTTNDKIKVLIATHSNLFSKDLAQTLDDTRYETTVIRDEQALKIRLEQSDFDLCLMRDSMPHGLELCARFSNDDAAGSVPIVVFSPQSRMKQQALASGAVDFLKLPCAPAEIIELVTKWGKRRG